MPTTTANRLAVISGGGTGIGRATAERLADAGCDVVLLGRRAEVLEEAAAGMQRGRDGVQVTWYRADASDPYDVEAVGKRLRDEGRDVDVLINNAGSATPAAGDNLTSLAASWLETYRANVVSAVLLTSEIEPMLARPGGRVVLIGSRAGLTGGASPAYVAAKAALHGWALSLAGRLGPDGITVNAIAPGFTEDTELVAGRISAERRARLISGIAVGRPGRAVEIAAAIEFLTSPAAGFVNGQVLAVDGGLVPVG